VGSIVLHGMGAMRVCGAGTGVQCTGARGVGEGVAMGVQATVRGQGKCVLEGCGGVGKLMGVCSGGWGRVNGKWGIVTESKLGNMKSTRSSGNCNNPKGMGGEPKEGVYKEPRCGVWNQQRGGGGVELVGSR